MARRDHLNDPDAPLANSLKVAVSALVRDQRGRVLLIRRTDNGMYSIPGGGQELGETVAAAIVREVKEETGIDVVVTAILGVFSDPRHVIAYDNGEVRQEFSICFYANPIGGEPRPSSESDVVRWAAPEELSSLDIHPSIMLRIVEGLNGRVEPYFT
ncbi:NUDIX hydrolase [Nocardia sp. NPDC057030]|uniref:NUDIX hydrolase n=1 Tax=unclassified Nocardia TaxID=2637762 RepID=UPI00362F7C72